VLFSSGSAVFSSPMLGSYAAANAALDALAHQRRLAGRPALSVNWGFWAEGGMAARYEQEHGRGLAPQGMHSFRPAEGIAVLEHLLAHDATQVVVLPADWARWAAAYPEAAGAALLREILAPTAAPVPVAPAAAAPPTPAVLSAPPFPVPPSAVPAAPTARNGHGSSNGHGGGHGAVALAPVVEAAPPAPQPAAPAEPVSKPAATPVPAAAGGTVPDDIESYLRDRVAQVLGVSPKRLSAKRPLNKQGLDSLMAVEVRGRVQRDLGVLLPITKMLGGQTLAELATEIAAKLGR
jgi:epothilone polyketide synthase D